MHHRNMAFGPAPHRFDDDAGNVALLARAFRLYVWPHRWPVLLCAAMLSAAACAPYLMAFYGRVVLDHILVVGEAPADSASDAAIGYSAARRKVEIDPKRCYGCGSCRSVCAKDAIALSDRRSVPVAKNLW